MFTSFLTPVLHAADEGANRTVLAQRKNSPYTCVMAANDSFPDTFPPFVQDMAAEDVHLRLLNLTDLHMAVRAYDYFADQPSDQPCLERAAAYIAELRNTAPNTLVFDNGDFLQGTPMADHAALALKADPEAIHPMIAALNAVRIDAATLGNHEFNYGLPVLLSTLRKATFPVVCANVAVRHGEAPTKDKTLIPPYRLLQRQLSDGRGVSRSLTVGVIGFVPPQIIQWDRPHLEGQVQVRDIEAAARAFVPRMRAEGADLVIALSHSGIAARDCPTERENASLALSRVPGIDAIITGHSHKLFPSPEFCGLEGVNIERGLLNGKPATMAGFGGSHVGVIDLQLRHNDQSWRVTEAHAAVHQVPERTTQGNAAQSTIVTVTKNAHDKTLAYIRKPVGKTDINFDSYFAMIEPASAIRAVAAAQSWHITQALKASKHARLPLLSAAAPFKMGGHGRPNYFTDVRKGTIAMRNVADLYLFPNTICALRISGAALINWLEYSAGIFCQLTPMATGQRLLESGFAPYNFDTISGLTYQIDLSQPARFSTHGHLQAAHAQRIRNLLYQGEEVTADMEFLVATNSYRAGQGGNFPGADEGKLVFAGTETHQEILRAYFENTSSGRVLPQPSWSFAPMPGTAAVFETSSRALQSAQRLADLNIEVNGESHGGWQTFRKHF